MKNNIDENIKTLTSHLFREHYGKMVSYLSQKYGYHKIEDILDAVQESFETALNTWKFGEVPENPFAWLHRVANNKLVNKIRQSNIAQTHVNYLVSTERDSNEYSEKEVEDSLLKLLIFFSKAFFTERNKLIISLYFLCGFNYSEIANALIIKTETVKKVVLRSKETIKEFSEIYDDFQIQTIEELSHLLKIIYLLYNEGYKSSQRAGTINLDLCFEAIRLGKLLHQYHPENPEINSLLAGMFFNSSRFPARTENDTWISLENQNRTLWNNDLIKEGFYYLEIAKQHQQTLDKYYLEALISSMHCTSESYEKTDWKTIAYLYKQLEKMEPYSIPVKLNRIIAESNFKSLHDLLPELITIENMMNEETEFIYLSTKAHFYAKMEEWNLAIHNYELSLNCTKNKTDINFISGKINLIKKKLEN